MSDYKLAYTTPADAPRWKRWVFYSPLARIIIFGLMTVLFTVAIYATFRHLGWTAKDVLETQSAMVEFFTRALAPLLAYIVLVKWIERRRIVEIAPAKLITDGLIGITAGLAMVSVSVGLLAVIRVYSVDGINPHMNWLGMLTLVGLGAAIGEEFIFRGVLFRVLEEWLGTWWALAGSALLFGAIHLGNDGATLWSGIAITIAAGLMLGLIYHVTRSLVVCIGFHAAWNFFEGPFFGSPVSGFKTDSWLISTFSGPDWLTGGAFGLDGSAVLVAVCSLITIGLLVIAFRRGSLVACRPWQRIMHRDASRH